MANNAATHALAQRARVIRFRAANSTQALAAWISTLVAWNAALLGPNTWASSMYDNQVSGAQ